jgi:hypothetical protein
MSKWAETWLRESHHKDLSGEYFLFYSVRKNEILFPKLNLFLSFFLKNLPGAVVHTCNPSYSGGGDQEDCCSRQSSKKFAKPHLNKSL